MERDCYCDAVVMVPVQPCLYAVVQAIYQASRIVSLQNDKAALSFLSFQRDHPQKDVHLKIGEHLSAAVQLQLGTELAAVVTHLAIPSSVLVGRMPYSFFFVGGAPLQAITIYATDFFPRIRECIHSVSLSLPFWRTAWNLMEFASACHVRLSVAAISAQVGGFSQPFGNIRSLSLYKIEFKNVAALEHFASGLVATLKHLQLRDVTCGGSGDGATFQTCLV